jgi:hypothetical protein
MQMEQEFGYYNSQLLPIIIKDDKIKIGTKIIPINKIYDIHIDYLTNYNSIFTTSVLVGSAVITGLLYLIIFRELSMLSFLLGGVCGMIYVYFIHPSLNRKRGLNSYIKIIDLIYQETHETIVLKGNSLLEIHDIKFPKKNWWQKRALGRYLGRIRKSRRYLIKQSEINQKLNYNQLHEKYNTVAQAQYGLNNNFTIKQIEILIDNHRQLLGKYSKFGYTLARITILFVIIIFVYMALNKQLVYKPFF